MRWKDLNLKMKLLLSFGLVAILTIIVGWVGLRAINDLSTQIYNIGKGNLPSIETLLRISEAQSSIGRAQRGFAMHQMKQSYRDENYKAIESMRAEIAQNWKIYEELPQTPEEKVAWQSFVGVFKKWEELGKILEQESKKRDQMSASNIASPELQAQEQKIDRAAGETRESFESTKKLLDEMVEINSAEAKKSMISAEEAQSSAKVLIIITAALAAIFAFGLGFFISQSIALPMGELQQMFSSISKGRIKGLNVEQRSNDEIGQTVAAANRFVQTLQELTRFLEEVGHGDLTRDQSAQSTEDEIATSVNTMLRSLRDLVSGAIARLIRDVIYSDRSPVIFGLHS